MGIFGCVEINSIRIPDSVAPFDTHTLSGVRRSSVA